MAIDDKDSERNVGAKSQRQRVKEAARDLECDEDEAAFEDRLRRLARQKPTRQKLSD